MSSSIRKAFTLALVGAAFGGTALVQACSATPDGGGGSSGTGNQNGQNQAAQCAKGANAVSTSAGSCKNPTIPIVFSSMYSAYIPGDSLRSFSIPVVTKDGCPMTWSVSDPSQVILHAESFGAGTTTTPGAMVTTKGTGGAAGPGKSGEVTVIATDSTGACGAAVLTITQNTDDDWSIGNARYGNGVSLHPGGGSAAGSYMQADGGSFLESDGGTPCASCHSQTMKTGKYQDVAHTPEQAGGFSDTDMKNIILAGEVPDGGYFDPSVIDPNCTNAGTTLSPSMPSCGLAAYTAFRSFHAWPDIGADQVPGMICYLRSLPPEGQSGTSNFGAGR